MAPYKNNREEIYSFGIPELTKGLRRQGLTLNKFDTTHSPGAFIEITPSWTIRSGGFLNTEERRYSCKIYVRKETSGLSMIFAYGDNLRKPILTSGYELTKVESHLKPGTYRYYIKDPFSSPEGGLCTKLYYLEPLGEFVPRSVLVSWGVRYSQQRKSRKDRYYFPNKKELNPRYRKSHYRGKETPFWRRYQESREEENQRYIEFSVGMGFAPYMFPAELERQLLSDYCKHTGRKTTPSPYSLYNLPKRFRTRRR